MKEMALQGVTIELHWYSNGMAFHLEMVSFFNSLSCLHKSLHSAEAFLQVRSMHVGAHLYALLLKVFPPGESPPRAFGCALAWF